MIGLIDSVQVSTVPGNSDVRIDVTGRDLIKLLIEDGCYFYPTDFIPGGIFANDLDSLLLDRIEGKLQSLAIGSEKSIGFALKFLINNLSNVGICPDDLFEGYAGIPTPIIGPVPETVAISQGLFPKIRVYSKKCKAFM